jgi:hypothetical protein
VKTVRLYQVLDMANKKVDPLVKQVGVCGCVTTRAKQLLVEEAVRRGVTVANVIGGLLEGWALSRIPESEGGYLPYRHHQEEKPRHKELLYKEGALGKILKKKH